MLWLIWHMWILIGLAFAGGVIAGWVIRSRSDETPERPMLEKLDATVVTPVEESKAETGTQPEAETSSESEARPETEAAAVEPAPIPAAEPKPAAKKPAAKKAPKPAAAKAPQTAAAEKSPQASSPDDLTQIKGLGPKAAEKLNGEGVTRLSQIAAWSDGDVERFDALINGRGRIVRDEWVKQAKALSEG